jgi:hypothetical protein
MDTSTNRTSHLKQALIVVAGFLLMFVLVLYFQIPYLPFKKMNVLTPESPILAIITSLFIVSIFMERTVETLLTPVRAPDRQKIEHAIEDLKKEIEELKGKTQSTDSKDKELHMQQHELDIYNLTTARRGYWISFMLGIVISFFGVRTLAGLIELDDLNKLLKEHQYYFGCFTFVDVVLTGGVIAGGSAAIDRIARTISQFLNLKSGTDSKQPA